jgi:hypothetical protein
MVPSKKEKKEKAVIWRDLLNGVGPLEVCTIWSSTTGSSMVRSKKSKKKKQ